MRRFSALLMLLLICAGFVSPVAGQDATTPADLVAPDPANCKIEPRTTDELASFIVSGTPIAAVPAAATPALSLPAEGDPADEATMVGVKATAEELFACYNAGDMLRVFALFTDDYLKRSFAEEGVTADALEYFAMPAEARPPEAWESIAVTGVVVLPDGRIGAYLHGHNPEGEGVDFVDYTIFVKQDGRYLIDDVIFLHAGRQ